MLLRNNDIAAPNQVVKTVTPSSATDSCHPEEWTKLAMHLRYQANEEWNHLISQDAHKMSSILSKRNAILAPDEVD